MQTVIGIRIGYLIDGTVIIEELFALPGSGRLALNAIYQRDYPTVQGIVLFIALMFVLFNMLTDLTHSLVDPAFAPPNRLFETANSWLNSSASLSK